MQCNLSEVQKKAVLSTLGKIVSNNMTVTPEGIVRNIYDTTYEAFVKKDMNDLAVPNALAAAQFAAQNIHMMFKADIAADMRNMLQEVAGKAELFTEDAINELGKIENLKEMFKIKDTLPARTPSSVKVEDVAPFLEKIKQAFPQVRDIATYTTPDGKKWTFTVLRDGDKVIKLPEVTDFLNSRKIKEKTGRISNTLRAGNMTDMVVREFLRTRVSTEKFVEGMMGTPSFLQAFADYTENKEGSQLTSLDPLFNRYAEGYLKDMAYALAFIEQQYEGYFLTDLTSLLDKTGMSKEDKERFFLYSAEIGLKGELDILAIAPDGSFRVIDIKTTHGDVMEGTANKYNKQTSIYDLIIQKATGLKSQGQSDIVYLTLSMSNASNILGRTTEGRYKLAVTDYRKESRDNKTEKALSTEISLYKTQLDASYSEEIVLEKTTATKVRPFDIMKMTRGRLKMLLNKAEELSTQESLQQGKAWIHKVFPELREKNVQILKIANSNVGGEFFLDAIKLYEQSNRGVAYHEGWHRFTQLFLTKEEKQELYDKIKKRKKDFTTRDGRQINTATASILDLEEYAAEEFKDYSVRRDSRSTLGKIFDDILRILKSITDYFTGNGTFAMENMFQEVYSGSFNRSNFSPNNSIFTHLNSFYPNHLTGKGEILANDVFIRFRNLIDLRLTQYLSINDITISEILTSEGLDQINKLIYRSLTEQQDNMEYNINSISEELAATTDNSIKEELNGTLKSITSYNNAISTILSEENDRANLKGFVRSYLKRSTLETLSSFSKKNEDKVNRIIDEKVSNQEVEEDAELDDFDENPRQSETLEYDRSGNEKQAIEQAREELKDFFAGIPRRKSSEIALTSSEDLYEYDDAGLPLMLSREEAFYKTLVITEGSITEENIIKAINDPANMLNFPELVTIRERLLGGAENEGLIPKMNRLTAEIKVGDFTNVEEHSRIMAFISHFTHVMSMRNVKFQNFTIKLNYDLEQDISTVEPLKTRDSLESIINNIVGDFTKGFQNNMRDDFKNSDRKFTDIFQFMHDVYVSGKALDDMFFSALSNQKFLYDPVFKNFYFNSFYGFNLAQTKDPSPQQMKQFFSYLGINLNENVYDNKRHREELKEDYNTLRDILIANHRKSMENASNLATNTRLSSRLKEWKELKNRLSLLPEGTRERQAVESRISELQMKLRGYVSSIFSHDPINSMLFDSRDKKLIKKAGNRIFAINRIVFENIAKIEKLYHRRFSSGSMMVLDDLQYSYFLPNQMIIVESLINKHINRFADFDLYPALNHLNPRINPQILNSALFRHMFDITTGEKRKAYRLGLTNIAQINIVNQDDEVESKVMSELRMEEKLLTDMLMVLSEGSSEIRRLETSNTAYRLSLMSDSIHRKLVTIDSKGFRNPTFLAQVRNYITHGAWKYKFYQDPDNAKEGSGTEWQVENLNNLGVFDEMIPLSAPKVKEIVRSYKGDLNGLMQYIETTDKELFDNINEEIINYFEDISIRNPDSFKVDIKELLSEKSKDLLSSLSNINSKQRSIALDINGNLRDDMIRDYIANDFIMAMEDSLIFFGDYTFYKDPAKRRKIIGNNGSIDATGPMMREAKEAQHFANSLEKMYQDAKQITSTKNHSLVRKGVIKDISIDSKVIARDQDGKIQMVKEVMELRKQTFGLDHSYEKVLKDKTVTINAFTGMAMADAAAYVSLSTYRTMMKRELRWGPKEQREYDRQMLFMKKNLGGIITEEEQVVMNTPTGGFFNVAKFALTGPVHSDTQAPFRPTFDKMGLRVLLPEFDWNTTSRPLMEYMLGNDIDYMVFDSGSKGYTPIIQDNLSEDGLKSTFDSAKAAYIEHAGEHFKNQQNTSGTHDVSTFSSQLRGIFFEIMLIQEQHGKVSSAMQRQYEKFIKTLSDYVLVNSSKTLSEMGLDNTGKIKDNITFINYIKGRLESVGTVSDDLTELLSVNHNGTLSTFLEALPFHRDIANLMSGIIDDNFRKIKLNGSKLYQSPEVGTTISLTKEEDLAREQRGTVELKWHGLERDPKTGLFISTTPVEVKINFSRQWESLFNIKHPDGEYIGTGNRIESIRRLNEAIRDSNWMREHQSSILFIGVRIPLQDINFSSHMVIREFLPESVGDMIVAPPEFYQQTGSDNDIDSVTVTFKFLDDRGKPISKPTESYEDIINKINDISREISEQDHQITVNTDQKIQEKMDTIKQSFIDNDIYLNKGKGLAELEDDLTIVEVDGMKMVKGQLSKKSVYTDLIKRGEANDQMDALGELLNSINKNNKKISNPLLKELNVLNRKRSNYIKGLTNDIISSIIEFMQLPENYDFLTETDSIESIQELAARTLSHKSGRTITSKDLGKSPQRLTALLAKINLINHRNNSEIRTILGSIVKFRRLLTTLAKMGTKLNAEYRAGSPDELRKKGISEEELEGIMVDITKQVQKKGEKTYARTIYTPLLYKKDTSAGIDISIFNENGERTTKDLSMLASSLLDLFKKLDVFPSLGITWLNVKTSLFLIAQGVPLDRVVLFMNNPIVQDVQHTLEQLGSDAQDRHAIVTVSQKLFESEVHPMPDTNEEASRYQEGVYIPKIESNGKTIINRMMKRQGKASQKVLTESVDRLTFKITEEELEDFTVKYGEYLRDPARSTYDKTLEWFLKRNLQYRPLAKQILAYYGTLLEDGDLFYKFYVKAINRDSTKHNSISSISTSESAKVARMTAGMTGKDFEDKLENETTQSPFYKDSITKNIIGNIMPEMLNHSNPFFRKSFIKMIETITSDVFGNVELKNKVEGRVLGDWIEYLYKNFYVMSDPDGSGKKNLPYEWFEKDITPLLSALIGDNQKYEKFIETFTRAKEEGISTDMKIESTFSNSLFANQVEMLLVKYPELRTLSLIQNIIVKREPGVDPGKSSNFEPKDIMNMLEQNYMILNLSANPKERMFVEEVIRDEWNKLINFDVSAFASVENQIDSSPERVAVYRDAENIAEIRKFFKLLAFYSLAQGSHLNIGRGSFSHLIPPPILKDVVETSIANFNRFIGGDWGRGVRLTNPEDVIKDVLKGFEKYFRQMNGELNWSDVNKFNPKAPRRYVDPEDETERPTPPEIYKPYKKSHTGKLYSKIPNAFVKAFQNTLIGDNVGSNLFVIDVLKEDENDPLKCKI